MKRLLLIGAGLIVAVVFVIATIAANRKPAPAATTSRPGVPVMYQEMATTTNCDRLREIFNRAASSHDPEGSFDQEVAIAYMKASGERMRAISCRY